MRCYFILWFLILKTAIKSNYLGTSYTKYELDQLSEESDFILEGHLRPAVRENGEIVAQWFKMPKVIKNSLADVYTYVWFGRVSEGAQIPVWSTKLPVLVFGKYSGKEPPIPEALGTTNIYESSPSEELYDALKGKQNTHKVLKKISTTQKPKQYVHSDAKFDFEPFRLEDALLRNKVKNPPKDNKTPPKDKTSVNEPKVPSNIPKDN